MAGLRELNSFIGKFVSLWQTGYEAHLHLNSLAGQAQVSLQVGLGQAQLPHHRHVPGPSRARRRERRAVARRAAEEATTNEKTAAEDVAEEVHEGTAGEAVDSVEAERAIDACATDKVETNAAAEVLFDEICPDEEYLPLQVSELNDAKSESNDAMSEPKDGQDLTVVKAVAVYENSPDIGITQDDINSLHKFICSEQHVRESIANIELDVESKSEVFVKLHVRRASLREGARLYILKHLGGNNFWTKQNGTKIKLVRIQE